MIPRLYVENDLKQNALIKLEDHQVHYIRHVLRLHEQDTVILFNGQDGEWSCAIKEAKKKSILLTCEKLLRSQPEEKELILLPALIKPARFELLVEKATEMGVTKILPLITDYTQVRKLNIGRMTTHAIEASEQSERLSVPQISDPVQLHQAIDTISSPIFWADESRIQTQSFIQALETHKGSHLLLGPEGGFSEKEKEYLKMQKNIIPVKLGPQVLRAETAGIVMIALYQSVQGTWRDQ